MNIKEEFDRILLEYLDQHDAELYRYAKSYEKLSPQEQEDYYFDIDDFNNWLEEEFGDDYDRFDDPKNIPSDLKKEYLMTSPIFNEREREQLFTNMEFQRFLKPQWLVHFTDDAKSIAYNGFKYGVKEWEHLPFSTDYKNTSSVKKYGGYNFAYLPEHATRYGLERGRGKYGKEAVMFQSSGTLWYHYGDQEPQVIFWGANAKNIIPINNSGGIWYLTIKDRDMSFDDNLENAIWWVVQNYDQYRKPLKKNRFGKKIGGHK